MAAPREDIHNSDVPVLCRSCEARHRGMCGVLTPDELRKLAKTTHKSHVEAGAEFMPAGTEVESYANVMAGVVKLSKVLEDGRQQIVGLQFAPDLVGRIFGRDHTVAAEAASSLDLCVVPREALERLIDEEPRLERRLMEQTLRELDQTREWMVALGRKTAEERVSSLLLMLATHLDPAARGGGTPVEFELPLKRVDIADFLGLTIETVSRQITSLKRLGVIAVTRNRMISILDMGRLRILGG